MRHFWIRFLDDQSGATLLEYALLAALLAVVALVGVQALGSKVNENFGYISNSMN